MALLTLNGIEMPTPTSLNVHIEDVRFAAKRALSGAAMVSRAAVKRRIEAYWAYLTPEKLSLLLSNATQHTLIPLSCPDPLTGDTQQLTVYSSARHVGLSRMQGSTPVWTNIRLTFTET